MATKALDRPINPRLLYSMDEFLFFFFRKVKTGESTGAHTQTSKSVAGIADSTRIEESNPPTVAIEYQKIH